MDLPLPRERHSFESGSHRGKSRDSDPVRCSLNFLLYKMWARERSRRVYVNSVQTVNCSWGTVPFYGSSHYYTAAAVGVKYLLWLAGRSSWGGREILHCGNSPQWHQKVWGSLMHCCISTNKTLRPFTENTKFFCGSFAFLITSRALIKQI